MNWLRKLLYPFSIIYDIVTSIRNFFYDTGFFKSHSFGIPVIAVGNLSTGGTGKTPQAEYLIRLLSGSYRVAVLSRGYKRKSEGFVLAGAGSDATTLGDEPYQFHLKFPHAKVAVDADRKNGIEQLLSLPDRPDVVLLDDAYQHRRVKAGFYILLTAYGDLYMDDLILPAGNLRESRRGAKRADIIVVTKCPPGLTPQEQEKIKHKLNRGNSRQVFFTFINYDDKTYSEEDGISVSEIKGKDKILVAGIAKPIPFFRYLQGNDDICLSFPDHHDFSGKEISDIEKQAQDRIVVTTEKDYMRLRGRLPREKLFYLPIKSSFISREEDFNKIILDYVGKSTGNR